MKKPDAGQQAAVDAVVALLEKMRMSPADLARRAGWSRSYVTQLLKNKRLLNVRVMNKIAKATGTDLEINFAGKHEPSSR
jgi:transcriptional regulator with XRE-family HTH domain